MFKRAQSIITYISVFFAITSLCLIVVELFCGAFFRLLPILSGIHTHGFTGFYSDYRVQSPVYSDKNYANKIYEEFLLIQKQYVPYTVWKFKEFHGRHTNIDKDGLRVTMPNNYSAAKKIFFFGGSTGWGTGVDDSNTIPSLLSKLFNSQGVPVNFTNYSQGGYQSTQEAVELVLQLQKGEIPDIVVFYDGINDVYASVFSPGIAAYHQNYAQIKNKLESSGIVNLYYGSNLYKFIAYLKERFQKENLGQDPEEDKKIEAAIGAYGANLKLVQRLSKEYGFEFFGFWQPVLLVDKKDLTPYESTEKIKMGIRLARIYKKSYDGIAKMDFNGINFINLSDIFKNEKNDIYIDFSHLGKNGNEIVAKRIFEDINKMPSQKK